MFRIKNLFKYGLIKDSFQSKIVLPAKSDVPAFQRTRDNRPNLEGSGEAENWDEAPSGFFYSMQKIKEWVSRLLKVMKTDAINERGIRTIEDGSMGLNTNCKLGSTLFAAYSNDFDFVTDVAGNLTLSVNEKEVCILKFTKPA